MATYPPPIEDLPIFNSLVFTEAQSASLSSSSSSSTPTGVITAYFGATAPVGWLMCDGSQFSSTEYVVLYNLLNSSYTPDLRGTFLRGSGTNGSYNNSIGQRISGQPVGSYVADSIIGHTHSYSANIGNIEFRTGTTASGAGEYNRLQYIVFNEKQYNSPVYGNDELQWNAGSYNTGYNNSNNETYPPNYAINYIIKT